MSDSTLAAHTVTLYHRLTWARTLSQNYRRAYARDRVFLREAVKSGVVGSYEECFRAEMYMCLWFSTLYIVVEAWPRLRHNDPTITRLLRSPYKQLLKNFRNATFHPSHWSDRRLHDLVDAEAIFTWAQALTEAFWHFLQPIVAMDRKRRRKPRRGATSPNR